jgi:hypothetical protein
LAKYPEALPQLKALAASHEATSRRSSQLDDDGQLALHSEDGDCCVALLVVLAGVASVAVRSLAEEASLEEALEEASLEEALQEAVLEESLQEALVEEASHEEASHEEEGQEGQEASHEEAGLEEEGQEEGQHSKQHCPPCWAALAEVAQ